VVFGYDGTDLAQRAIEHAAGQFAPGRCAVVVCVWQTADVGFTPTDSTRFDADKATQVRQAAERTAAHGASLAERAGFEAQSMAVEAAPTWKGIVRAADDLDASLIVLGPHRRSGVLGHLQGSVASAVIAHTNKPVFVVPEGGNGRLVTPETSSARNGFEPARR
jgi:nucleotide-binding universal stress UspA family protein